MPRCPAADREHRPQQPLSPAAEPAGALDGGFRCRQSAASVPDHGGARGVGTIHLRSCAGDQFDSSGAVQGQLRALLHGTAKATAAVSLLNTESSYSAGGHRRPTPVAGVAVLKTAGLPWCDARRTVTPGVCRTQLKRRRPPVRR